MRRCALLFMVFVVFLPTGASAASAKPKPWRTYSSRQMRIAFRYPPNWTLRSNVVPHIPGFVAVSYQGSANYALTIQVMPFTAAPSLQGTMQRFLSYERSTAHTTMFAHVHWTPASLGRRAALAGVLKPSTEGGSSLADEVYIAQWRGWVYEIVASAYHKPPFSRLSQFPSVYAQILGTWKFL